MNELYSSEERTKLTTFTNVYNAAVSDYASKKAKAENLRQQAILHPSFAQLQSSATLAESTAESAKQFAAEAKISLDDYQRFLTSKYDQTFTQQNPELAPMLAQIAADATTQQQIGLANAQSATEIALGLQNKAKTAEELAAETAAADKKKMYTYIGFGVAALIIGFLIYKQTKKNN